ncbi:MAG: hypothetical protein DKM50_04390 [Candidatus Margulisiibacteriota bacterium]|nr:MAG: hypothetical protein A2X43_05530 [Candidatus Margulisbacteria bacterium GWD2_39_127]OGI01016.1 MAG: hypothetical protein A2X42_12170 [Candidatus Margulisbacteria bacterium GWF2_38_17]OGI09545.1 MAG: hypothetical protein A2X41_06375 [Candidatus Margulisbacteria bacterium GWE2_39_32]PZM81991.1 MAG: hypothetical protein DKM50_04390 [Candidatus Margulisiibacteriota bacterium]HCT85100.1 hypothetical protein [Candidatus Margulisiibacteriota bacterium]
MRIPLCVHTHFYQPSRVDPFSGVIPQEYGSQPYSNFNEKILDECYKPNVRLGNIDKISFNIGPTLADWMELKARDTYEKYLAIDNSLCVRTGTGNAIAQGYNHVILPLLDDFDKEVQIYWGICDFKYRFRRQPLGFWLPETAVDDATLRLLVRHGIKYIFLAPWQVNDRIEKEIPHVIKVDNKDLIVFLYNDPLTRLLINYKKRFSASSFIEYGLLSHVDYAYNTEKQNKAVTLVSDGEFFGHHMKGRENVLARVLQAHPTVLPSHYLDKINKLPETRLKNNTSWTCFNHLKRWRGSCNLTSKSCIYQRECYIKDNSWTEALWNIFDTVKKDVYSSYLTFASYYFEFPDKLILEYINYKKGLATFNLFCDKANPRNRLEDDSKNSLIRYLEAVYYCQLMFTSCGFFFEDIDRIEPKNNLKYLKKVLTLMQPNFPVNYQVNLISELSLIKSTRNPDKHAGSFYREI